MKNVAMSKTFSNLKQHKATNTSMKLKSNESLYNLKKNYSNVSFKNNGNRTMLSHVRTHDNLMKNITKDKLEEFREDELRKEWEENEIKLKEALYAYNNNVRKNEGAGVSTLLKIRGLMLNWLKESDNDNIEYSLFMTEKKIKYMLKNKERSENKLKSIETDKNNLNNRKMELASILGDIYISYETEELEREIEQFSRSYEIKSGKSSKMLQKFEEMKKMLVYVKEYNNIVERESSKSKEYEELSKFIKNSNQTLEILSNYYKNLKKRIGDMAINIK